MTEKGLRVPALVRQALDALGLRRGECVGGALSGGGGSGGLAPVLPRAGMGLPSPEWALRVGGA